MVEMREITDDREHGPDGFDAHAFIPRAFFAEFAVGWHSGLAAKTPVCQHNRGGGEWRTERMQVLVGDVHGGPIPGDPLPCGGEDGTQLDPHTPTPFVQAFLPHVSWGPSRANRKDEFKRVTITHAQQGGRCQKMAMPFLVRHQ